MRTAIALVIIVSLVLVGGYLTASTENPLQTVKAATTACGTSATQVAPGGGQKSILLGNKSSTIVYVGGSAVNTTVGWPICNDTDNCLGTTVSVDAEYGAVYCIVASATTTINHLHGY